MRLRFTIRTLFMAMAVIGLFIAIAMKIWTATEPVLIVHFEESSKPFPSLRVPVYIDGNRAGATLSEIPLRKFNVTGEIQVESPNFPGHLLIRPVSPPQNRHLMLISFGSADGYTRTLDSEGNSIAIPVLWSWKKQTSNFRTEYIVKFYAQRVNDCKSIYAECVRRDADTADIQIDYTCSKKMESVAFDFVLTPGDVGRYFATRGAVDLKSSRLDEQDILRAQVPLPSNKGFWLRGMLVFADGSKSDYGIAWIGPKASDLP